MPNKLEPRGFVDRTLPLRSSHSSATGKTRHLSASQPNWLREAYTAHNQEVKRKGVLDAVTAKRIIAVLMDQKSADVVYFVPPAAKPIIEFTTRILILRLEDHAKLLEVQLTGSTWNERSTE